MLQVTDSAATAFRNLLNQEDVPGTAIRLAPTMQQDGQSGITLQAIDQPAPEDQATDAKDVQVVVAPELAPSLDEAVLDARPTDQGAEFYLRPQSSLAS